MGQFEDLTGRRFGRLTVLSRGEDYVSPKGYRNATWNCLCDCGSLVNVRGCNIRTGASQSCGCIRADHPNRRTHGMKGTRLYGIWKGIKDRCLNARSESYRDYGGRGVGICDEWINSFESFRGWSLCNGYRDDLSIDRIDVNGNYEPSNCRWSTAEAQANNKRNNHLLTFDGRTQTISQWAKETGISPGKIKDRINKCGWSVEKTLTTN